MGPKKVTSTKKSASGGKVFAPGCTSKPDGESREEPEEHKRPFPDCQVAMDKQQTQKKLISK